MAIDPEVTRVLEPLVARVTALEAATAAAATVVTSHAARIAALEGGIVVPEPQPDPRPDPQPQPEPEPDPRPGEKLTNPSVGINLAEINDWTTELPFLDQMKHAREWIAHQPGDWGGIDPAPVLDANGWPRSIPAGATHLTTLILTGLPAAMTSAAGRYRLTWTGKGKLELWGNVRDVTTGNGVIHFDHVPNGSDAVFVDIKEIDRTSPLRITGIVHERHAAAFDAGEVFNPDFLALVRDLRVLRFMDWQRTNNHPHSRWQDRAKPGNYTYSTNRGVPLEVMIDLANKVGADPWFCMPHLANADHVNRFATMVRNRLDKRLKAHVEYSNEVWNWQFDQAQWAHEEGRKIWPDEGTAWVQFAAGRAVEMARIIDQVFAGQADRVVKVIATQTGWMGLDDYVLGAPDWTRTNPEGRTPASYFDAYAVTGYFSGQLGQPADEWTSGHTAGDTLRWLDQHGEAGTIDRCFPVLEQDVAHLTGTVFAYHKGIADREGLKLVMYEGGSHVVGIGQYQDNPRLTALFAKLHRDPRMGRLYARLMDGWKAAGGTANAIYADVMGHGQFGPWGHLEHLDDRSVRWDALTAFNRTNPGWWEERAAGTFLGLGA